MATEDERYRQSSQFRLWSFTKANLQEQRERNNALTREQIAPRLPSDPAPEFLSADEELQLVKFFTIELLGAAQFIELPTEIRATAAVLFRRFYVTNSIMTYPPRELLKTSLFFGCKAEGFYIRLGRLVDKLSGTTSEEILAGEFLLCQGVKFAFDVRHPFRPLEGAILELRRRMPGGAGEEQEQEERINRAHGRARDILKFSSLLTDAYFHYAPSQIMMAALQMADEGLVEMLVPQESPADMRQKIMGAIASCRAMLEEEPPERMASYWKTPETLKSIKPLRKKLQKCRDPDRANLVELQRARREQAAGKEKKPDDNDNEDGGIFGEPLDRDSKRRKVEKSDPFGGAL
ncbi:hypothetical protein N3K66_007826 [Trichothecium roseum]|uniref:Uncharacterized protein n=1 Tax=Trichothecium roseum TaxID=47278 RepID=A0ACC0UTH5_9HYPO|nr:hypothetical protein N3K66_007826 [Trichothecium roseum]